MMVDILIRKEIEKKHLWTFQSTTRRNQERECGGAGHFGGNPGGARGNPHPGIRDPAGLPLLPGQGLLFDHSAAADTRQRAREPCPGPSPHQHRRWAHDSLAPRRIQAGFEKIYLFYRIRFRLLPLIYINT